MCVCVCLMVRVRVRVERGIRYEVNNPMYSVQLCV